MSRYDDIKNKVKNGKIDNRDRFTRIYEDVNKGRTTVIDDSYINTFIRDANNYINKSKTEYQNMKYGYDVATAYKNKINEARDLSDRAQVIRNSAFKTKLGDSKEILKYLDDFTNQSNDILSSYRLKNKQYSKFASQSEYMSAEDGYYGEKYAASNDTDNVNRAKSLQTMYNFYKDQGYYKESDEIKQELDWLYNYGGEETQRYGRKQIYANNQKRLDAIEKELSQLYPILNSYVGYDPENPDERQVYYNNRVKKLTEEKNILQATNAKYEHGQKITDDYYDLTKNADFKEDSAYRIYSNPTKEELSKYDIRRDSSQYYTDAMGNTYDAFGAKVTEEYLSSLKDNGITDKLGMYLSASENDKTEAAGTSITDEGTWASVIKDGIDSSWDELTDGEIEIYYYLMRNQGKGKAEEYLAQMTTELNRRAEEKRAQEIDDASALGKLAMSIASIPANILGGTVGFVEDTVNTIQGKDINPYSKAHSLSNYASEVRSSTAQDITDLSGGGEFLGISLGDVYQALMSGADSAVGAYGLGSKLYGISMFTGAASSEAKELYEQGASKTQIALGGLLSGAAEGIFETISIENLISLKDPTTIKDIIINTLKQGATEFSEEMNTEIANALTDAIVMSSESELNRLKREYINQGYSETEASAKALMDIGKNVWKAGVGGMISGSALGGISSSANYAVNQIDYNNALNSEGRYILESGNYDNLIALATEVAGGKKNIFTAEGQVSKQAAKTEKNASAKNVGKLSEKVDAVRRKQNQADIQSDLMNTGASKARAHNIAKILSDYADGIALTTEQRTMIAETNGAREIMDLIDSKESSANIRNLRHDLARIGVKVLEDGSIDKKSLETHLEQVDAEEDIPFSSDSTDNLNGEIEAPTEKILESENDIINSVTLEEASKKYGERSSIMIQAYIEGQNISMYDAAYKAAYDMGKSGISISYALESKSTEYLSEKQKKLAYNAGVESSITESNRQEAKNKQAVNGRTGHKKGIVKSEGVKIADLKASFNDIQGKAYKLLSTYAEVTGIDIVLYKSEVGENGEFEGAQGKFKWDNDTIYIDVNAGLKYAMDIGDLAKYTMVRTFAHEFTHFIEKWNPVQYNEFRSLVFKKLTERRENVHDLIETKQAQDSEGNMSYEEASREVVAEAMTDILPDAKFVQELAEKHKNIFEKLLEKLKEFVSRIKEYYSAIGYNRSRESNALKKQIKDAALYIEDIVTLFDKAAVQAVENYQRTVALEEKPNSKLEESITEDIKKVVSTDAKDVMTDTPNNKTKIVEEEKTNVKQEQTDEFLRRNGSNGQRTPRLLGEVAARTVQGIGEERNIAGNPDQRREEAGRHDLGPDAERGDVRGHGKRSSESGDLRGTERVTEEPKTLHEEVAEQISRNSTEKPKGRNFVIGESLDLPNGEKARCRANIEAIKLVKKLENESRYATETEQNILSKYVGWGGLANAFDDKKPNWSKEYVELKELLTEEEYALARSSTLTAYYTDISIIKAMYDGLQQLGFDGGRMLEPSSGVGNFVGAMPADMSAKVKSWTMVELDSITGMIAKYLYPNADVRIQGFETTNIPDNYMDVAISNVPFGNHQIVDKAYPKKVTRAIHNYFFAKSLDKVRPGGIVMFITSSYTMNSKDNTVRHYIMKHADLLGAIRLPNTAFKGNAGTEAVADILVLKKRTKNTDYAGEDFLEAPWTYPVSGSYSGANINVYFKNHPEMVLGTPSMERSMHRSNSLTYKAFTDKGSLADQIREAFSHIQGKMDYPAKVTPEEANAVVEKANKKTKNNGLVVKDGKVYTNDNGVLKEKSVLNGSVERVSGLLDIRDAVKNLQTAQQQGLHDSIIKKSRQRLNNLYDTFVKKYGYINSQTNRNVLADDPDKFAIYALENYDNDTKKATKADIFLKNTISPNRTITSVNDITEGLIVSINQTGGVDISLIAKLTGKKEDEVTRELIDSRQVFKNRNGLLESAEVYLSGNVRAKLRDAEALLPLDDDYAKNVEALKAVVPENIGYHDIFVNPGTPWIPDSVYSDFAAYMLNSTNSDWNRAVTVTRNPETGNFTVELNNRYLKTNAYNTQKWGTSRRTFIELFDAMLNSKSVVVKYKTSDGTTVIDKDATAAANEKIENIQKEFQEWLWKDEERKAELETLYNETFNAIVTPKYNGDNLTINGINAMKPLRPHQRNAVQRIISSGGNTLLAHKVGAGKTYEMAAAAMKLKELGLVKKPLFAVPKSLVAQWGNEFIDFFPSAKLLVAEASDFTAANRKVFANRIANGDYDAVIVSYEQFEKLPISNAFARKLYQEQIDTIIYAIEEAKIENGEKSLSVKDLEKKRKSLQAKIDKLTDSVKDEDNIEFEQLGVDSLFIDEAHNFKNLFYTTSMTNVAGLGNKDGSKRAFDLYTKVRYLQKLNGGRGIVFATATPVMNSMSEMYIMQKYLQPDLLEQLGLSTFDAWAKQFGEVVNGVEIKPSGQGYRVKQSFSRFKNMSELQLLFRNFADVLTEIPGLKIPKMKGGRVNVVVCEPGQFQKDYMKELEKRADNVKNVDPSVDNMLKITSDGRKISYTQRMIDPTLPYEEGCKIYRCADNVARIYQESNDINGTQLIFCDMATPKGKSKVVTEIVEAETDMESTKLYDDIKSRLIRNGIPAKEIAFIHNADTDAKKKKLFSDVNNGKVRILIGSTGKMGVGMNAQKRVAAIHHLDAPWRPGDVEQRNGRAFRQGNINEEVECFTYVTEGSFDARLWDILERKQNFINQVMNGENIGRETEDTGEVTLSAAEVKALASGSPLIMEQVQLDTDIKKLESLRRAHNSAVLNARDRLVTDRGTIANLESYIANGKADIAARKNTYSEDDFSIKIGNRRYSDKKEAGIALMAEAMEKANEDGYTTIGNFAGFDLRVIKTHEGINGLVFGKQGYQFKTYPGNTTYMINQLISIVSGIDGRIELWQQNLLETQKDIIEQEKLVDMPFAKQAELDKKRSRYNEVMSILNPKEEQSLDSIDDSKEQHQSRGSLEDNEYSYEAFVHKPENISQHYGHTSRPSGELGQNVLYQQRTNTLTDRDILEMAADTIRIESMTEAEKDALRIFKQRLSKLGTLQEQRKEEGKLYKEQQFGVNSNRTAAAQTLNRMHILDEQIQEATASVLSVEEKNVLQNVLKQARKVVEQKEREHGEELLQRWRDRRNEAAAIKKYRERLRKDVDELTNWILHPSNKENVKHIPDALKNSVIPFLSSINFMSKRSLKGGDATKADETFIKQLNSLKSAIKQNIDIYGLYSGYNDLPTDFMDKLQGFIDTTKSLINKYSGELVINQMKSDELKELSQMVRTLKKYIMEFNRFHANAMYKHVYEAGDNSIEELSALNNASSKIGNISNFINWQQIRPAYAFERFGSGGMAIYDGLRRGQARLAFNAKKIQEFAESVYTAKEVEAWEKEIVDIKLGEDIVKMPAATIMSFYELSKRPQALGHILGQGVRVATYKSGKQKISDIGHVITEADVHEIINALSLRQREVADKLQKFMALQGGHWGNEVSVKRFGEELFGEETYFPIHSDDRYLQATADEQPSAASLYALLNMSFTKELQSGANNRIILYSIFDVFSNHMASMAQYNALALPVLDALKWFNYQQVSVDKTGRKMILGSVREQMDRVYGTSEESRPGSGKQGYAQNFVINILKAFNGTEAQGVSTDTIGIDTLRRYNMAQIAYSIRTVVQQPMSILRAGLLIDYRSIIKGMCLSPTAIKQNIDEMQKCSGIAAWKGLGFYDINISRGLTDIIKHKNRATDRINEVGLWGAEKADLLTWAGMWSACKEEVIKKQNLTPRSKGFLDAVTTLFEDVIYKTQVVDSILTKNEYLRSRGFFARAVGSFMSEPTTTASMLIDAHFKYSMDVQRGMSKQEAWKRNKRMIGRVTYVYCLSATILAAVQAIVDAYRDDDEYETWPEKWLDAFGGNLIDELMPFNKLPILNDLYELVKDLLSKVGVDTYGNTPRSVLMQWRDSLAKGTEILYDKITGQDTNYTWYSGAYKMLQALSGMTGLPMAAITREFIVAWNNTIGEMAPSLKVKTYDLGDESEIKYAFMDGYLTAEEAKDILLEKELVDSEQDAEETIHKWNIYGKEYSNEELYELIMSGDIAYLERLTELYPDERDIVNALKKALQTGDARVAEAAQARIDGDTKRYNDLVKTIIGEGFFEADVVKKAVVAEENRLIEDEESPMSETPMFRISDYYNSLVDKDYQTAKIVQKDLIAQKVAQGDAVREARESVENSLVTEIGEAYISGNIKKSEAQAMMLSYGGHDELEAAAKIREWDFEIQYGYSYSKKDNAYRLGDISKTQLLSAIMKVEDVGREDAELEIRFIEALDEYPDVEISASKLRTYYKSVESTGISVPIFAEYSAQVELCTGEDLDGDGKADANTKKKQIMAVIDSLPITLEQKDALYDLNNWSASKRYQAPWH